MIALGVLCLCIWIYLWLFHAHFWKFEREPAPSPPEIWPSVVVIIPARNEAQLIAETLRSLAVQDYASEFRVVLVDDRSEDGTALMALATAREIAIESRLMVLKAEQMPDNWMGKVWAMNQGVARGVPRNDPAKYVLFSDADICHGPGVIRELVCRAESTDCDLVSLMVKLQCHTLAERLMIPAFVFFFRMLYPFRLVNNPGKSLAGAAGGTMLVRRSAIDRIGGLESIKGAIIDDCSLAQEIKRGGHCIWLGLSDSSISTRTYGSLREIIAMISRTAYTQLKYSPINLIACVAGLSIVFLAPPAILFTGGWTGLFGGAAWLAMTFLYLPMILFYRQLPLWALLLPVSACCYLWATLLSAWHHHRGKGQDWRGVNPIPQVPK